MKMWDLKPFSCVVAVLVLHSLVALVSSSGARSSAWKTLTGSAPLVIARGGFSGIYPDSSLAAYNLALNRSSPNVILWCDVQLTKDRAGICFPDVKLNNATDISNIYPNGSKSYLTVDYALQELANVSLVQGIYSRTQRFDGNQYHILRVEDVAKLVKQPGLWLNIQNDAFFKQQNLSMTRFLVSLSKKVPVSHISSPDLGFLRSIRSSIDPRKTKLVLRILEQNETEPSTKKTYRSILKDLNYIKTFASGILVPKGYIWPVDSELYLQPHTSIVSDAHGHGLQVFASELVNDLVFSYNYSYDPVTECLNFIDNGAFSVDGVLSDFPVTPSTAINCFSNLQEKATKKVETLVISKYGASGDYPACTDLAYKKAKSDGADVLDCPVQMSKDRIPFCLSSIDLTESTTIAESKNFTNLRTTIPEIKSGSGIFSFSLTSNEIKSLTPLISNPYQNYKLYRNPKFKNQGKLLTLSEFLSLAKNLTSGILISIENATYLAEKQNLSVTDAVLDTLSKAGYDKQSGQRVMIQSTQSSVLMKFKEKTKHERVYKIDESVRSSQDSAVADIKTFADSVVIAKSSVFPLTSFFLVNSTNSVSRLKASNLSVYVETFSNEFVSQAWDYYSDASVEINSFVVGAKIDGIITDFPKTADRYRKNKCLKLGNQTPPYMRPVEPGSLLQQIRSKDYFPPPAPPLPIL